MHFTWKMGIIFRISKILTLQILWREWNQDDRKKNYLGKETKLFLSLQGKSIANHWAHLMWKAFSITLFSKKMKLSSERKLLSQIVLLFFNKITFSFIIELKIRAGKKSSFFTIRIRTLAKNVDFEAIVWGRNTEHQS